MPKRRHSDHNSSSYYGRGSKKAESAKDEASRILRRAVDNLENAIFMRCIDCDKTVLGGQYKVVRAAISGGEVHHMPSCDSVPGCESGNPLFLRLPGIWMTVLDHRLTASHGQQGDEGRKYRQLQANEINKGNWQGAIVRDYNDLKKKRSAAGDQPTLFEKYKCGIDQYRAFKQKYPPNPKWDIHHLP